MSRKRVEVAEVQFQITARQANASMRALQAEASTLNEKMTSVKEAIERLGNVDASNPTLQEYSKTLKQLKRDYDDVNKTMKDYTRGVKAADELLKAYDRGNIEGLSMKAITSGINGIQKRIGNIDPDKANAEELKAYRILTEVVREAQRVMNDFRADVNGTIDTLRGGGTVAEDVLKKARDNAKSLMESVERGTALYDEYSRQYEYLNIQVDEYAKNLRRERGELVDANDARRAALQLTEEGAEAMRKENDMQDAVIAGSRQVIKDYQYLRQEQEKQAEAIRTQMATQDRLIEARQRERYETEKNLLYNENEDKRRAEILRKQTERERERAEQKREAYEQEAEQEKLLRQHVVDSVGDTAKLAAAEKAYEEQKKNTAKTYEAYIKAEEKATDTAKQHAAAQERVTENEKKHAEVMAREDAAVEELNKQWDAYNAKLVLQEQGIAKIDEAIAGQNQHIAEAEQKKAQNQALTIKRMETILDLLRQENATDPNVLPGSEQWKQNERLIGQVTLRLEELKKQSAELRREPVLDMMTQRMDQLGTLSRDALTETKKFWQAMYDGADKNDPELKKIEERLRNIATEEERRTKEALVTSAGRLGRNDLGTLSANELRQSIEDAKRLQATYKETSKEAQALAQMIVKAEEYQKSHGVEAVRQVRREQEAIRQREQQEQELAVQMRQRLMERRRLSADALAEVKKYWLAQKNGAEEGTLAFRRAEAALKMLDNVEQERNAARQQQLTDRLSGRLSTFSTAEIKESIEAAKQLVASYKSGSHEATELTKKIIAAEEHLDKYSIETARKTKKDADELKAMQQTFTDAQKGSYAGASMEQLDEAIKRLKAYQATIKFPNAGGKTLFDGVGEQIEALTAQLDALKGKTDKAKAAFQDADEVMKRFNEHMKGTVVTTPGLSIDEQLSQHVSHYDDYIKSAAEEVSRLGRSIKEETDEIKRMEHELAELEKKHQNSSWFRKQTRGYKREASRIEELRDEIEGRAVLSDDDTHVSGRGRQYVDVLKGWKQNAQETLDYWKQQKAEALGLVEVEEQVQKARRMTREEMQQGIKLLEEEAMAQDRSTADGQKRWEQLRKTIGEMNQELKEATGEWMKLGDAQKIAEGAGKKGFAASAQEIQQATQALERRREELIRQIRAERDLGNAVDAQEKELDDLTKKLRSLKFEQDNVNMSQEKMRTLIETPANAVNLDELRAAIKRADGQLRQMEQSLGKNSDEYKRFAEQVRQAKNVMKEMEGQAKASATAWEKAFSRLKTYVVMYMGFNSLWQKVSGTLGDLMQLSDRMGEVGKTTQMTAEQVGMLTDRLRDLDTRTSLVALTELSAKAGQLGLKTEEDILGFTEAANKMLVALPEMGADGATQMMKVALATGEVNRIKKDMDKGLIEGSSATAVAMEKIASTIDQLRANSAAAAPQITDFVKRVGAVGAQSGISIDQVAALGSTVDALGMRVEMSATALSRMIPAIRNNAFEVAKAIGMAPEALRKMFDEAGGGMNAMLAIFQHIKDAGMTPNDIEKMLGMGGMRDIMKDLNQQGARAGIVFAGLSQNVDVLRQHLGIAAEAYEENVAIQQEYDRMSETTAAKWERLKNQFEEMWVGTSANNALGGVIDALRVIVDLISGPLNTAFNSTVVSVVAIKSGLTGIPAAAGSVFDYLKESAQKAAADLEKAANATDAISDAAEGVGKAADVVGDMGDALSDAKEAGEQAGEAVESATGAISGMGAASKVSIFSINGLKTAWKGLDTTMKTNIIVAVIALLYTLGKAIYNIVTSVDAEKKALAEANQEADRATEKLGVYFDHLKDTTAELDAAKKATEGLTAGTDKATEAEIRMTKATDNHRTAIANINQNYSKYLGFMLTEYDRAEMVAAAHDKIAAAIRREILMRQKQASIEENEKKHQDDLSDDWAKIVSQMTENDRMTGDQAASARLAFRKMLSKSFTTDANGDLVASDTLKKSLGSLYNDRASLEQLTAVWMARHLQQNYGMSRDAIKDITGIDYYKSDYGTSKGKYVWTTSKEPFGNNLRGDYLGEYFDMQRENAKTGRHYQEDLGATEEDLRESTTTIVGQLKDNINAQISLLRQSDLSAKERNDAYAELARALEGVNENVDELETAEQKQTKQFVTDVLEKNKKFIDSSRLQRARDKILQGYDAFDTLNTETNNIWGNRLPAESTDWKNMTAEQLVNRRKQMADFVNAIQTDTDVKAVLEEDKALKKAIEAGMSSDMRTVIEWYNTERLKIQDELHARHLTNTGDWRDPKQQRAAKKQWHDEIDAYLHELDAYYTERKTVIEQARNDEEITEGEAWRRTIQNDNEWQTRRAELQKIYADKSGEVTKEEMDAIYRIISERTGDTVEFVRGTVARTNKFAKDIAKTGEKGAAMIHKWESDMDLSAERSFLKAAQAIGKQMKFIEETLAKERPYDGITKNLQDNLDKMGVLAAKYRRENEELARQNKAPKYSNEQITAQSYDEMAFYLRQAADAYSIDIDELLRRMVKEGMTATAEEISKSDMLKQAVMGQLRKTYQEVQDAIKKEASQIKKDVEIIWNDDARGIGGMSMKATFDKAMAQLGMQQDSVSRANSLIGAGAASDNVASRLAMKQIEVQMRMQKAQYDMYRVQANQRMAALRAEAEEHRKLAKQMEKENHLTESKRELLMATNAERDAENVRLSLGLTLAEETKKEEQQKAELLKIQEESQNRLYTSLREWADLLTSSLQGVIEASHAGDAEYYNERAKLNLTGKGGPGAGTYVVIDDAGTSDATAHYEYLDERQALERQHEIERENAQAEAWRKLMDDINMKMSEQITDWMNAALQNQSIDANTQAVIANTKAIYDSIGQGGTPSESSTPRQIGPMTEDDKAKAVEDMTELYQAHNEIAIAAETEKAAALAEIPGYTPSPAVPLTDEQIAAATEKSAELYGGMADLSDLYTNKFMENQAKMQRSEQQTDQKIATGAQSAFAKMAAAANMYGLAYQTMSNNNLSTAQKFQTFALQAAGQAAIAMLTTDLFKAEADQMVKMPGILGKLLGEMPYPAAMATYAGITALMGGLMGLAASQVSKSKSQIAQATGSSVGAGRLATGMLTYAEGNVNELTDPASLTPGRQYNVDGADGKTYRARYMGKGAKTHITNGPEFHLVGEAGREAIIDAKTTRLLQLNETGIWRDIQTLYNGGSISGLSSRRRRGTGMPAFADGNVGDFEEDGGSAAVYGTEGAGGFGAEQMAAFQSSLDKNNELLERALANGIKGVFGVYGPDGIINAYDTGKKNLQRYGVKY